MNTKQNEKTNILEINLNEIKVDEKTKILPHVYEEYSENEIRQMLDMYNGYSGQYELKLFTGDEIQGEIVGESPTDILVDIGYKDYVRIEKRKDEYNALVKYADDEGTIQSGTVVDVLLTDVKDNPYIIKGSISALSKKDAYSDIIENSNTHVYNAKILNWNPAGFDIEIIYDDFKIAAFMPNTLAGINKLTPEKSQSLIGETLKVMIESYVENKGTFIASRKKYLKTLITKELENINIIDEEGKPIMYEGEVTGSTDFGIFVEFNKCLTGMIHRDNLNDEYKQSLKSKTIIPGSTIKFHIKEIVRGKLILTQLWRESLWDTIKKGDVFESVVKDFKNFGTLVRLDEETVGLIHASEMEKINKKCEIGDTIKVEVIVVQRMERKIYLSVIK